MCVFHTIDTPVNMVRSMCYMPYRWDGGKWSPPCQLYIGPFKVMLMFVCKKLYMYVCMYRTMYESISPVIFEDLPGCCVVDIDLDQVKVPDHFHYQDMFTNVAQFIRCNLLQIAAKARNNTWQVLCRI